MQFIQALLLIISLLPMAYIMIYATAHKKTSASFDLFLLVLVVCIWSVGSFCELYSSGIAAKLFWRNIQQIGAFLAPILSLFFAVSYTEKTEYKKHLHILAVIPLSALVLLFTNNLHHIMRANISIVSSPVFGESLVVTPSLVGNIFIAINFSFPIIAIVFLLLFSRKISPRFKKQLNLVTFSIILTVAVTLFRILFLEPAGIYLFISVLFVPSALIMFFCLFRYNFLALSPIARDKLFEVINQGILVLDKEGVIADANTHAKAILCRHFTIPFSAFPVTFQDVFSSFPSILHLISQKKQSKEEIHLSENVYISMEYYPLTKNDNRFLGAILIINDITPYKLYEFNLIEKAEKDGLTNLLNREGFLSTYNQIKEKLYNDNAAIAVFMIDLDFFKKINDSYGHTFGDKILIHFSELLQKSLRGKDLICRLGGDEFAILLPGITSEDAFVVAEKIRSEVNACRISLSTGKYISYTVSIGIADNSDLFKDISNILNEADIALYQAKNNSRNCTYVYPYSDQ